MFPAPGYLPFEVKSNGDVGATLSFFGIDGTPWDMTGGAFLCQVRRVDGGELLGAGEVVAVDLSTGMVSLTFHGAQFAFLVPGSEGFWAVYDLRIVIDGKPYVLLEGTLYIRPGVSGI